MTQIAFRRLAWTALAVNLFVILWGALVRASGSGAGCGGSWPTCDGSLYPALENLKQVIEYTHRVTSGGALLLGIALAWGAFRVFEEGSRVRRWAVLAVLAMLVEALLGASLVIFGLVGTSLASGRPIVVGLHLINTFLLLGAFTMTARCAREARPAEPRKTPRPRRAVLLATIGMGLLLAVGLTGALTALGHTLGTSTVFRNFHPALALGAVGFIGYAAPALSRLAGTRSARRLVGLVHALLTLQLAVGATNYMLGSPIWAQLLHLGLADGIWIGFVLLSAEATDGKAVAEPTSLGGSVSDAA